ncbi:MAG TPA: choice-of-anchor D domain-containing protein [Candidatus Solibacter sp.]|nr:choice-of-anchor D domain-containing protein [Candidatus Solibacter sp.]
MYRKNLLFLALLGLTLPALRLAVGQQNSTSNSSTTTRSESSDDEAAGVKVWDDVRLGIKHFWADRTRGGPIPPNVYDKAKRQQWDKLPKSGGGAHGKALTPGSSLNGVVWRALGPNPIQAGNSFWNGRTNGIALNPYNANEIFQGASSGGVWRTNDAGNSWAPLIDHEPSLAIGEPNSIAIDPNDTNTVYVGGSNYTNDSATTVGLLKTTDGGGSWIVLGSGFPSSNNGNAFIFQGQNINGVAVDPANSNIVYLAASNGLFTSSDGGNNWTQGINGLGYGQSLVMDASSPAAGRVIFAGVRSQGVFESNNGGASWSQALSTSTPAVAAALATHVVLGQPAPGIGKVIVSLDPPASPANPAGVQVVYVVLEGTGGNFPIPNDPYYNILGIFQSTDQGATWTQRAASGLFPAGGACQCFYTNTLAVDPGSPGDGINDILYWGGTDTFISTDAGNSFTDVTNNIHADSHSFAFFPQPSFPSIGYAGNDGGIWRTTDNGTVWSGTNGALAPLTVNAGGLQTSLIYHMDVKRDSTASVTLIALQDNGTAQYTGSPTWTNTAGGDGIIVVFDQTGVPANESLAYAVNDGGPMRSTDSGSTWSDITSNIPHSGCNNQVATFSNTLDVDPSNAGYLYFGGTSNQPSGCSTLMPGQLFQTMNGGGTWRQITSFTANSGAGPTAVAPANANIVAVVEASHVYLSTNALAPTVGPPNGVVFTDITRNLPGFNGITQLAFDPNDPTTLYATLSGFSFSHVLKTTINGSTWTDLTPALNVPYNTIALDGGSNPTGIYVGTDLGVLRSFDGGLTWSTLDDLHLPNAPVTQLRINPQAGVLRAATYGRGVFDFAQPNGPVISVNVTNGLNFGTVCTGVNSTQTFEVINTGTQNLIVYNVQNLFNSTGFSIVNNVSLPISISPDSSVTFTVQFTPTAGQVSSADIRITSNDPSAPFVDLTATGSAAAPSINATIANSGNFGSVCPGGQSSINLNVTNQSSCNLVINNIVTSAGFLPPTTVTLPLILTADATVALPLTFAPSISQACSNTVPVTGTVTVFSNDPTQTLGTTIGLEGTVPCPKISSVMANNGVFGNVCSGKVSDLNLEILNTGQCNLNISSITSSSAQFQVPGGSLVLSADANVTLPVAFQPAAYGSPGYVTCSNTVPETSNIDITSNDPTNPILVTPVQGIEGCPTLVLGPLNLTGVNDFSATVSDPSGTLGCHTDKQITVSNTGICPLIIPKVTTVNGLDGKGLNLPPTPLEFNVVNTKLPITLNPNGKPVPITVRFAPKILTDQNQTAPDQQTGTLQITSNDPVIADDTAALCGEPAYHSGTRILLVDTLNKPISSVANLILTTTNITPPFNESLKPAPLQPPANVCGNTIYYHLDNETLNPTGNNPNAYYRILVKDNPHYYPPTDFRLTQCQLQQIVVQRQY